MYMNDSNLRVPTSEQAREYGSKGGLASAEARKRKKTLAEIVQIWAEAPLHNEEEKERLKALGLGEEEMQNKASLLLPLLDNIKNKGDIKAFQMISEFLKEDKKREMEIKKLEAEIEKLKKEISGEISDTKIMIVSDMPKVDNDGDTNI